MVEWPVELLPGLYFGHGDVYRHLDFRVQVTGE